MIVSLLNGLIIAALLQASLCSACEYFAFQFSANACGPFMGKSCTGVFSALLAAPHLEGRRSHRSRSRLRHAAHPQRH